MKNKTVSVIIPVYNVAQYLEKCVLSVIKQTLSDIEIILIDDGSTDSCPEICDKLAKDDDRIRVIHKTNGGLSSARNAGLDIAQGKYVYFLDSDDWIMPETLHDMVNLIDTHDIVIASVAPFFIGDTEPELFKPMVAYCDIKRPICTFSDKQFTNFPAISCNKLYKKSIIDDFNLRFDEHLINEDEAWTWYYCTKIKSGIFTPNKYYNYLIRPTSITGAKTKDKEFDIVKIIFNIYEHLNKYKLYNKFKRLFNKWAKHTLNSVLKNAYNNNNTKLCEYCIQMASMIHIDLNKPQKFLKRLFSVNFTYDKKYRLVNLLGFTIKIKNDFA